MRNLFLLLILFSSCSDNNSPVEKHSSSFKIYSDSRIQNNSTEIKIESGDNLVFEYVFKIPSEPDVDDSGFTEKILFEIDPSLSEFEVKDDKINETNCLYRQICYCENTQSIQVDKGVVKGTKIDSSTWSIMIDIEIDLRGRTIEKRLSHDFFKE